MASELDDKFYDRADAFIHLGNEQCKEIGRGKVSASFMYAVARFNAWVSARGFDNASEMSEARAETLEYFVQQYKAMLEENFDDYVKNFEKYMK